MLTSLRILRDSVRGDFLLSRRSLAFVGRVSILAVLLTQVTLIARGEFTDAALVDAAARQDWARVRSLVDQGVEVNGPRADGVTALLWAAHWDDLETVRRLLAAGADTNAADDHGVTPLMRACENASVDVVRALLSAGADANAAQTSGLTPLMLAAGTGSREVVRALLERGADVNPVTQTSGVTALMWAAEASHLDIAHILVESGADVSLAATKGFTPLLLAARNGDIELATLLIAAGADVNQPGSDGAHPLPFAIVSSQDAFALFLLEQGADPNGTLNGVPALHAAAGNVSVWLGEWYRGHGGRRVVDAGGRGVRGLTPEQRLPLVKALLARGADPNGRITASGVLIGAGEPHLGIFNQQAVGTGHVRGATPLWVAAYSMNGGGLFGADAQYQYDSNAAILQILLAAGASPSLTTDEGTTPLMMAAGLGPRSYQPLTPRGAPSPPAEEAVRILVEAGANVNTTNHGDFTALHGATFRGLNEVIEYLVEQGADIDARDYRGRTAFRMAEGAKQSFQFQGFPETAALLKQLGANTRLGIPGTIHERADRLVAADTRGDVGEGR